MPVTHGIFAEVSRPIQRKAQGDEVNHWRLFFAVAGNQSVSFDMVGKAADNPKGIVGVIGRDYPVSDRGVLRIPMIHAPGLTVARVLDLLEINGLLRYKYTPSGEGCRYWVQSVVHLLKRNFLLYDADKMFPQFDECIGYLWRPGNQVPMGTPKAIERGTWY
jgi:hypothetical protein